MFAVNPNADQVEGDRAWHDLRSIPGGSAPNSESSARLDAPWARLRQRLDDIVWSVPTLATLNPVAAPIAHAGLHVSAVFHSYQTDTFLPPHE